MSGWRWSPSSFRTTAIAWANPWSRRSCRNWPGPPRWGACRLGLELRLLRRHADAGTVAGRDAGRGPRHDRRAFRALVIVVTCSVFALAALPSFFLLRERARPGQAQPAMDLLRRLALPGARRHALSRVPPAADVHRLLSGRHLGGDHAGGGVCLGSDGLHHAADHAAGLHREHRARPAPSFGYVQDRIGHKRALAITLCGWILMVLVAYAAVTAPVFWVAATLAGLCMGTTQRGPRHDGRWRRPAAWRNSFRCGPSPCSWPP